MVLVDPKRVELNHYEGIPHLLTPVVTSPRLAANVLGNLIKEMEERYGVMSRAKTRSLVELNRVRVREGEAPLPYILCVIDELADLMMVAPADVEDSIIRLAQKSRAVGIHLVLATQRPSADVITGMIKANVPGADRLRGLLADRLARDPRPERRRVAARAGRHAVPARGRVAHGAHPGRLHRRGGDRAGHGALAPPGRAGAPGGAARGGRAGGGRARAPTATSTRTRTTCWREAIATVVQMGTASTSMLQRRLRVGYTRAGRLIDMMERRGVISGYEGSKARQVLITEADLPRVLESLGEPAVAGPVED